MALTDRPTSPRPPVRPARAATPAIARMPPTVHAQGAAPARGRTSVTARRPAVPAPRSRRRRWRRSQPASSPRCPAQSQSRAARARRASPGRRRGCAAASESRGGSSGFARPRLGKGHADGVQGDTDASGEGQQADRSAQQRGVDAPPTGEPTGDTEEYAVGAAPRPRRWTSRGAATGVGAPGARSESCRQSSRGGASIGIGCLPDLAGRNPGHHRWSSATARPYGDCCGRPTWPPPADGAAEVPLAPSRRGGRRRHSRWVWPVTSASGLPSTHCGSASPSSSSPRSAASASCSMAGHG